MVVYVDLDEEAPRHDGRALQQPYMIGRPGDLLDSYADRVPGDLWRYSKGGGGGSNASKDGPLTLRLAGPGAHAPKDEPAREEFIDQRQPQTYDSFAMALGCYPVVKSITQWLDLNSLFSLSLTCRQFRANLLQFRSQLVRQTLRCEAEEQPLLSEVMAKEGQSRRPLDEILQMIVDSNHTGALLAPKIGKCARDLVGECRNCARVVCRNCTSKPLTEAMLRDRFRRLCATCLHAPLDVHTSPLPSASRRDSSDSTYSLHRLNSSTSSNSAYDSHSDNSHHSDCRSQLGMEQFVKSFTTPAFSRTPCSCQSSGVWLCQPCGQGLRSADITYKRVWTWRSRYSTHIGGLGTGMGEGNQGQKCGRGEQCLAAKELEVEIDCSAAGHSDETDELIRQHSRNSDLSSSYSSSSLNNFNDHFERRPSYEQEPGYFRQEIEGIGGVVKKKVKKRVRVGATVTEYDDEQKSGKYLEREVTGKSRSWCGWCSRVVPSNDEYPSSPEPPFVASYPSH